MQPKAPSQNEAVGIAHRVTSAMAGDHVGFETAQLAWLFANSTERANELLRSCADKLGKGMTVDAYVDFNTHRTIVETIAALEIKDFETWTRCCERFSWRKPEKLKTELARLLKDSFNDVEGFKDSLLSDYRSRLMAKKSINAYPVVRFLATYFDRDQSLQNEYSRITTLLTDELEADMLVACGSAKAEVDMQAALDKYRAVGFEIPNKEGLIEDALLNERRKKTARLSDNARLLTKAGEAIDGQAEGWLKVEQEYMTFAHALENSGEDKLLSEFDRESLDRLRQKIGTIRGGHDTCIQIADALNAIGERDPRRDEAERLDRIVSHANLLGYPIEDALLERARAALEKRPSKPAKPGKRAKERAPRERESNEQPRSRTPIYIGAGVAAVIAIGVSFFAIGGDSGRYQKTPQIASSKPAAAAKPVSKARAAEPVAKASVANSVDQSAEQNARAEAEAALATLFSELDALAEKEPTPDTLAAMATKFETAKKLGAELPDSVRPTDKLQAYAIHLQKRQEALAGTIAAAAEKAAREASRAVRSARSAIAQDHFDTLYHDAAKAIETGRAAYEVAASHYGSIEADTIDNLEAELAQLKNERRVIDQIREEIASADSLSDYYRPLHQMLDVATLPQVDKATVARVIDQSGALSNQLQGYLNRAASGHSFPALSDSFDPHAAVELDPEEQDLLSRLVDNRTFSEVYTSTLRYHQGSDVPVSESIVYLAKEVESSEQRSGRSLSINFVARGYDAEGRPRFKQHSSSYLENRDGTVWGYFYTPSELSRESNYYNKTLNPRLKQILTSPSPLAVTRLIEEVARENALSETFRLYWVQQFVDLMDMAPGKWGHQLAPSIANFQTKAQQVFPEKLGPTLWRASEDEMAATKESAPLFEADPLESVSKEIVAFSTLLSFVKSGQFVLAGHVDATGATNIHPRAKIRDGLWTLNSATGQVERLDHSGRPLAFAPIVGYQSSVGSLSAAVSAASEASGLDLQQDRYRQHLPMIFAP